MANTLVTPTRVMREVGRRLINNLKFGSNVNRSYSSEFSAGGAKQGYTVNARLPQRYVVSKGAALVPQGVQDLIVPITLTDQANVGLTFNSQSLTMEVEDYKKRYIDPAVDALVSQVDFDGLQRMYQAVWNCTWYGTTINTPGAAGTLPGDCNIVYLNAGVKLSNAGVPSDGRIAILSPGMHAYLASANLALFNPSGTIGSAFKSGQFGSQALGVDEWFSSQNVATHTTGTLGGTPAVTTTLTAGATSVVTKSWSNSITNCLRKGDVIQFSATYAVNPMNRQTLSTLQDFVVTSDFNSDGSGTGTVYFAPAMYASGALQNVSALPVADNTITIFGHASNNTAKNTAQALIYNPDAFALVVADLEMPGGLWVSERISSKQLGISIRFLKDYSITTDESPARVDILYGWKAVRPEMAVRVCG